MRDQHLDQAVHLLQSGQCVAIPTETVYGLAANALDSVAVTQIFRIKNRPFFDPLIVHVASIEAITPLVRDIPPAAQILLRAFSPGPLTLLLPRAACIPDLVTAGSERVAIRIPAHPVCQALLQRLPFPLAAPSANPFGYISPTTAAHVAAQLGDQVPLILDGGPCRIGLESTIVGFEPDAVIHRHGGIAAAQLAKVLGQPLAPQPPRKAHPQAPGMLDSHYAPRTALHLPPWPDPLPHDCALLRFRDFDPRVPPTHQRQLSVQGDLDEAARNLFAAMRELDALRTAHIFAETVPQQGLGQAINDRLYRAAAPQHKTSKNH